MMQNRGLSVQIKGAIIFVTAKALGFVSEILKWYLFASI